MEHELQGPGPRQQSRNQTEAGQHQTAIERPATVEASTDLHRVGCDHGRRIKVPCRHLAPDGRHRRGKVGILVFDDRAAQVHVGRLSQPSLEGLGIGHGGRSRCDRRGRCVPSRVLSELATRHVHVLRITNDDPRPVVSSPEPLNPVRSGVVICPLMCPQVFEFGFLAIKGYGLMLALAVPASYVVVQRAARRFGLPLLQENLIVVYLAIVVAAYVGGKLGFLIGYPDKARDVLDRGGAGLLAREGFVYFTSIMTGVPASCFALHRLGVPVRSGLDALTFGLALAHGFGRIGCFLGGCCYGCFASGPFAVTYPPETGGLAGVSVHPVQLYEAAGSFLIFAILWWLLAPRRPYPGAILIGYLVLYSVLRLGTEFLRGDGNPTVGGSGIDHVPGLPPDGLTQAQVIALATLLLVVPLLWRNWRSGRVHETPA